MVIVRKTGGKGSSSLASNGLTDQKKKTGIVKRQSFELPTEASEPEYDLNLASILIHGEEKIGKTSLASKFPDPLFLMFEPGGKFLRIKRIPEKGQFAKWEDFVGVVDKLETSTNHLTVILDTADLAYELCVNHIVSEAGEEHIGDGSLAYGKGADRADNEFKKQIIRITSSGRGIVFISHSKSQEFQQATGTKYNKLIPTMKERARRFLKGFADITGYYGYFGTDRFLVVEGSDSLDAGHRIDGRFLTTSGETVHSIPMGDTPEEGYNNFVNAFNNLQEEQNIVKRKVSLSEVKAKFVSKK